MELHLTEAVVGAPLQSDAFRTMFLHPLGVLFSPVHSSMSSPPESLQAQSSPVPSSMSSPPDSLQSSVQSSTLLYVVTSRLTAKLSPVHSSMSSPPESLQAQSSPVPSSMSSTQLFFHRSSHSIFTRSVSLLVRLLKCTAQ